MNPLTNLGPVPRVTTPRATTVRHRAPNVDLQGLTAAIPPALHVGQHGAPVVQVTAGAAAVAPPGEELFATEPDDRESH